MTAKRAPAKGRQSTNPRARPLAVVATVLGVVGASGFAATLPVLQLQIQGLPVLVEVALTAVDQVRGLSGRAALPPGQGMLFPMFHSPTACVWMKDTALPLSVAFVDAHGFVVDMAELQPYDLAWRCSAKPASYILEMPSGWFDSNGVSLDAYVDGLTALAR